MLVMANVNFPLPFLELKKIYVVFENRSFSVKNGKGHAAFVIILLYSKQWYGTINTHGQLHFILLFTGSKRSFLYKMSVNNIMVSESLIWDASATIVLLKCACIGLIRFYYVVKCSIIVNSLCFSFSLTFKAQISNSIDPITDSM